MSHTSYKPVPDVDLPKVILEEELPIQNLSLPEMEMDRRRFLKLSGLATGGLMLAFSLGGTQQANADESGSEKFTPNAYLHLTPDGKVLIYAVTPEVGQGVKTAFPMVVAEELDVDWEHVSVKQSEINQQKYGPQSAGGSNGTPNHFNRLRNAGATARTMLVAAAAKKWGVSPTDCSTDKGTITHEASGQKIGYGDICNEAALIPVPNQESLKLKDRKDYKILGKWIPGVDNEAIVTGKPLFGYDIAPEGFKYAVYIKCPSFRGKAVDANLSAVKAARGVVDAFIIEGKGQAHHLSSGVAIIADSAWDAFSAANILSVKWDRSEASTETWTEIQDAAKAISEKDGNVTAERGDTGSAIENAEKTVEAYYTVPFVAHASMEPMNCTAHFKNGKLKVWAPTQTPQWSPSEVEIATGIPAGDVEIIQLRIGGGFGRRLLNDYVCEVAAIAKQVDYPVKLVWTREQDTQHDQYRVGGFHKFKGALDASGKLSALKDHFVTFTAGNDRPVWGGGMGGNIFPFDTLTNSRLETTMLDSKIPCGWWRAPGSVSHAWVIQSFLHELSTAAGRDHVEFLLELLGESRWMKDGDWNTMHTGRAADVIKLAAQKGNWGQKLPKGHGRGIAFYFSHKGHFAEVAEVSVNAANKLKVHKVTVAGDVGFILNKSGAENQIEGSVIDGFSTMMGQEITFSNGAVDQSNFHDYSLLRMSGQPKIDIHMIENDHRPTGLGEPALPPIAPAICNAIFEATGKRIRTLPITREGFSV